MQSLRQLGNQEIVWEIKGFTGRDVVLHHGGAPVGAFKLQGLTGRTCVAECVDGRWRFDLNMLGTKITISAPTGVDRKGQETYGQIGEMTLGALKGFTSAKLVMADGHVFQFKLDVWQWKSAEWVEEGTNTLYMRFGRTSARKGILAISPAIAPAPETPLLAIFGVYFVYLIIVVYTNRPNQ